MELLKTNYKGINLYNAGHPNFLRNFTRDSIISAILTQNSEMLRNQLKFCSLIQGKKKDPFSGEEPGKIHHEYPEFIIDNQSTLFNACDTTALFLIGHKKYQELTGDFTFAKLYKNNINMAVEYTLSHLKKNLFYEDPKFSNASKFALKVTYWKDSEILDRKDGEPSYPIIYTLAHIQNMVGMKSASALLGSNKLMLIAKKMSDALQNLWDNKNQTFYLALDGKGKIGGATSDALHALFYLEKEDITKKQVKKIENTSRVLETKLGYRTMHSKLKINDPYHSKTIWPFEQAIIHIGARKFGLRKAEKISSRIIKFLDSDPEYFIIKNNKFEKAGCDPQLWTIAAKQYFQRFVK